MPANDRRKGRLFGIFLLGMLLFNYPLLSLFNLDSTILGIPVGYVYMFLAWTGLILLMIVVTLPGRDA